MKSKLLVAAHPDGPARRCPPWRKSRRCRRSRAANPDVLRARGEGNLAGGGQCLCQAPRFAARTRDRSSDPFFRRFFGDDGVFGAPRERVQNSLGSGVIVDGKGLIVTNNHVIQGGSDIRVVLADQREFEAKLLLADERTDLAVLKIDAGR